MSRSGSTNLNQRARYRVIQESYSNDDISSKCKAKAQWARETHSRPPKYLNWKGGTIFTHVNCATLKLVARLNHLQVLRHKGVIIRMNDGATVETDHLLVSVAKLSACRRVGLDDEAVQVDDK